MDHPDKRAFSVRALLLLLLLGFATVAVRCAWVTEDAYIMFRAIDNFLHGYGLTWNIAERVQVYTCPLWTLCLTSVVALTGEFYYTTIALSLLVSLAALGLIAYRIAPTLAAAILALAALTFSKCYVDFSTSGLENPLSHLLLVAYALCYFREDSSPRSLFVLTLLASLGMLNRLDSGLIYLPSLLWVFWQAPKRQGLLAVAAGCLPLLAWEAFSLLYYGFPFPNTAYAKLNLGIPPETLMTQGLYYYRNALHVDPMTLLVIALGVLAPFAGRKGRDIPLALGVAAYLLYIVKIGGDFMTMRFFSAPLLVSVILLCRCSLVQNWRVAVPVAVILLTVSWQGPRCPLRSGPSFGSLDVSQQMDGWGIADERGYYFPVLGMLRAQSVHPVVPDWNPQALERSRQMQRGKDRDVVLTGMAGMIPFGDGERVYYLDTCALGDPLLARLPSVEGPVRVGHYARFIPAGYVETLKSRHNQLADPDLARYYDRLQLIVAGDLWSGERLRAIWDVNTGRLDHLIHREHYRHSGEAPK